MTAPIWLRQIVADFDGGGEDDEYARDRMDSLSKQGDENYVLIDDSGQVVEPTYD